MRLRAQGWRVQAFTTPEYTAYQVVGDRQRLGDALLFVRSLLCDPPLPAGREADLRLTQYRQALDLPTSPDPSPAAPLQRLFEAAYGDRHTGAKPIVGSADQLSSVSATALRDHWQQTYRTAALTLVVSGGIDDSALNGTRQQLSEIDAHISRTRGRSAAAGAWPTPRAAGAGRPTATEPHRPGPQVALLPSLSANSSANSSASSSERSAPEAAPLWLGFALDGASPQDIAALEVATQLALPTGFDASLVPGPGHSSGLWVLRSPLAAGDVADAIRKTVEATLRLADGLTEDGIAQARRRLFLDTARRAETPAGQGLRIGSLWLAGLDEVTWQGRIRGLGAVDLRRSLSRFLQIERLSVLFGASSRLSVEARAASERRVREHLQALSARATSQAPASLHSPKASALPGTGRMATVLRSQTGAYVVLLPDTSQNSLPDIKGGPVARPGRRLVAFTALWAGGRHSEEARQRGLHDVLVRVWPRATATLPAFRFATLLSDLNLRLSAEVSDDALALRGQLPAENLPQGLAVLRDCIESPSLPESDLERARRDVVLASRRPPLRDALPRAMRSGPEIDAARYAWQLFHGALHRSTGGSQAASVGSKASVAEAYEDLAASVAVLTTRHLHDQLRRYPHQPSVLALVGDFDSQAVAAQLSPWLGSLTLVPAAARSPATPGGVSAAAATPSTPPPPATADASGQDAPAGSQTFAYAATQQAHLMLGARVPGCSPTPGTRPSPAAANTQAALALLLELLATESGIGQAQQALLSRRALAFTVEGIRTGCVPDSALALYVASSLRSLDAAEASLRDELRRFVDHPPDAEALELARERLASRWVLASQRRSDRSMQLARGLLFGESDPAFGEASPADRVRTIDADTLQSVAKRYFRDENWVRAAVLPDSQRVAVGTRGVSPRTSEPVSDPPRPAGQRRAAVGSSRDTAATARKEGRPARPHKSGSEGPAAHPGPGKQASKPSGKQATLQPTPPASKATAKHAAKSDAKPAEHGPNKPSRRLAAKPNQRL